MELSWQHLTSLLEALECDLGQVRPPCPPASIPEWTARLSFAELTAADQGVKRMTRTLEWPELDERLRAQLHLRLAMALSLCRAGKAGALAGVSRRYKGRPPWKGQAEALEHLLVNFWWECGVSWARDMGEE
jgi:hypothetical protein